MSASVMQAAPQRPQRSPGAPSLKPALIIALAALASHGWWDKDCPARVPITIGAGPVARPAKAVFIAGIDFKELLAAQADSVNFDRPFLRLLEVDDASRIVDSLTPFQYDPDSTRRSRGTLTIVNARELPAGKSRKYHLYLSRFKPIQAGFEPVVSLGRGRRGPSDSIVIATDGARYTYMKRGAGFARMVDRDNNDWIGHNPQVNGAAGSWRGLPCLALEQFGHPGIPAPIKGLEITSELWGCPVYLRIRSFDKAGQWETVWTFYPLYATMEVVKAPKDYWFAYEGAPGGAYDSATAYLLLPDSSRKRLDATWAGDVPSVKAPCEWVGIGDAKVKRVLFMVNHSDDTCPDVGRRLGDMAVVGFGRGGNEQNYFQIPRLTGTGHRFTVGFAESSRFRDVAAVVKAITEPVAVKIGKAELAPANLQPRPVSGAAGKVTITVSADSSHQFSGIGVNINSAGDYDSLSAAARKELTRRLFTESHVRSIRLWSSGSVRRIQDEYCMTGIVPDAVKAGVTTVALTGLGRQRGQDHANLYVGIIDTLRKAGYPINVMCFLNKPNTNGSGTPRWDSVEVAEGIKLFHAEMVKRKLAGKVRLIAPETVEWWPRPSPEHASKYDYQENDDRAYLNAVCNDSAALASLFALGLQSYGKGMTPEIRDRIRPLKKEMWITIGATDAIDDSHAEKEQCLASVRTASCLSDLNLGVSRWFYWSWWQWWDCSKARTGKIDSLTFSPTFHFFKTIASQIDSGAWMRPCVSDPALPSKDMDFNYTREPQIVAAAAKNPNGTWTVALVNLSGVHAQHYASYQDPRESRPYQVTVSLESLKAAPAMAFAVSRITGNAHSTITGERVSCDKGVLNVEVKPLELVVLRSVKK